jgi:hypothetical protein
MYYALAGVAVDGKVLTVVLVIGGHERGTIEMKLSSNYARQLSNQLWDAAGMVESRNGNDSINSTETETNTGGSESP